MKMFLFGDINCNSGPSNVNKDIIKNSDKSLCYIKTQNKFLRNIYFILYIIKCNVIIISGLCSLNKINFIKKINSKIKIIYLMHGDLVLENEINNLGLDPLVLNTEYTILSKSDLIICVSQKYADLEKKRYPNFSKKIIFINNGIDIVHRDKKTKIIESIVLTGGNRGIKNNGIVCKAVERLNSKGYKIRVFIFGCNYKNNDNIDYPFVTYMNQIPKEDYYQYLDKINLMILNSQLESFGLAVGDALNCNCSLLLSENVGAASIFSLTEHDIIHDTHNIEEITEKISFLIHNPNYQRLLDSIDVGDCSTESFYKKLKNVCLEL